MMMRNLQRGAACVSLLALSCGLAPEIESLDEFALTPSEASCAEFVPLGRTGSVLTDIDRSGEMVVGYVRGDSVYRAFRWPLAQRELLELGDRPEGPRPTSAQATGVSADGAVVVGAWSRVDGVTAYMWTTAQGYQRLEPMTGAPLGASTTALRANADGSVIVGYANDGVADRAARWQGDTGSYLTNFPSDANGRTQANAVSDDGRVIVGVANQQAFRWSDADGPELLSGDSQDSQALDVSANGEVVVGTDNSHAFRWRRAQGLQILDDAAPDDEVSVANAVSADGEVVVGHRATKEERHAFRWTAANPVVEDIASLLPAAAIEGWQLSEARAVSGDGQVIGGIGLNPDGASESWLVIVPATCP